MVSIITPCYNSEKHIETTINSVLNQTYQNWEMIIVDDASQDDTYNIVSRITEIDTRIKLFRHHMNLGAGAARNFAVDISRGDYIAFLDSDDIWKHNKLSTQINYMTRTNSSVCFSSYELVDDNGNPLNKLIEALPDLTYDKQLKCNYIGNLTGMYDVRRLGKAIIHGIEKRQDWIMWLNLIEKAGHAKGMKDSLAYYRVRKEGISYNKLSLISYNYRVYRFFLGYGFLKSLRYILIFLVEYFFIKPRQIRNL